MGSTREKQGCGLRGAVAGLLAAAALVTVPAVAAAAGPTPPPYGTHDAGGFHNILPPAQGTNANAAAIALFELNGTYPAHTSDQQLDMYAGLLNAAPGLGPGQVGDYYKDATFGVKPADVASSESPRNDVTIVRDQFGVPHIFGSSRAGAMFGAGYVAGEDRLFMMDVLRHAARADLSSFAGGSNIGMDESVWADTPYNEADLQQQYDQADELYGPAGVQIQNDVQAYVAGLNQFISEACVNQTRLPGEYDLIDPTQNVCLPGHGWSVNDVIAIASLVAGIFGKGGGGELGAALSLETARQDLGARAGSRVWSDFQEFNDPEAPTTVRGKSFHYGQPPARRRGLALPDRGSVQFADVASKAAKAKGASGGRLPANLLGPLSQPRDASNALLVPASESQSGRPLAVMGPQVAYWSPEILMEEDIHAPAGPTGPPVDARGAAFPGTNLYVQLGHGRNYAWSATSAGQDIIDTYALRLCDPGGGQPTIDSDHYLYGGQCLPFEVLTRQNSWIPTAADQTPPGSETLTALRTKLGIVIARGTIDGRPYAYTKLRDTYFHEVDPSALGFANFNNPRKMQTPRDFFRAANHISYTFNWFYVNRNHIAYFNSGQNPVRPRGVDPNLPTLGRDAFIWRHYDPATATEDSTPLAAHPHVVDQRFLTSWNNRQAPGYNTGFSSLFRSQMLDERVRADIAGPRKTTLPRLIGDMEGAASVDLRGDKVLPWILKVIGQRRVHDPDLQSALTTLHTWEASGAHRLDADHNGHYDQSEAVRIMDAWWPRLQQAEFEPTLGQSLYDQLGFGHDAPGRLGSAFDTSAYGYTQKDLRDLLGAHVRGPYSRVYCGGGDLGKCRSVLLASLKDALANDSDSDIYPGGSCDLGDAQVCNDAIGFRAIGAITQPLIPWQNRPTFQQAVEIP